MGVTFTAVPSNFNEALDDSRTPQEVAIELGDGKANDVAEQYPNALVIGSDTIVCINGKQLGKPEDTEHAIAMLESLAGKTHQVITSLVLVCKNENLYLSDVATTNVTFKPLDKALIKAYAETGDPLDKAGAYGIQSGADVLIESIEGYYDTVMGLPTAVLAKLLAQCEIAAKPANLESPVKVI
jgi:septum formation protein